MATQEPVASDTKEKDVISTEKSPSKIDYEEILKTEEKISSADEKDPELDGIPDIVKEIVSMEDDPTLPTLTFRYFLLSFIFVGLGAFVSQLSWFRTTTAPYSLFFVQICTHWAGRWLHDVLPAKEINIFGFKFNLNPGPFSIKEHVLITLSASSGATSNLREIIVSVKDLFYHEQMHPLGAIALMISTIWTGYSFAALARNFLIYDPDLIWPSALMQTTLYRTLRSDGVFDASSRKQMKIFWFVLAGVFVWEFFPEYIFPFTSSLAVLCWIAPYNDTVAFVGSGLGGMGVLNFTLDWSNITSSIMLYPWWTQVTIFAAFVLNVWILVPMSYFGNLWGGRDFPIMSNKLFTGEGSKYPFQKLITSDLKFNETAYAEYGPVYMGSYNLWTIFFGYCTFISAFMYIGLFAGPKLLKTFKRVYKREKRAEPDKLNKLMAAYPEVPTW
ncbi:OPT superfamily [Basidiobolus ranarum]|uniref:OPT superfamily n=1 Tax=Basidiobolus ranarum TaxID=34480 RepID=A0ABR2WPP1_9FUNG